MASETQIDSVAINTHWLRQNWGIVFALLLGGILFGLSAYIARGRPDPLAIGTLRTILVIDLIYILVVLGLIFRATIKALRLRRRASHGSKLHIRLSRAFVMAALIPTVLIAFFAVLAVSYGVNEWFSSTVRDVVNSAASAAKVYEEEQSDALSDDIRLMARHLNTIKRRNILIPDGALRVELSNIQKNVQRGLKEAYVADGTGALILRGQFSYLFDFEHPSEKDMRDASKGALVLIQDWDNNEFRALLRLSAFADRYLYVTRQVDGTLLKLLDETNHTTEVYKALDSEKRDLFIFYGLIYICVTVGVILCAIFAGTRFAEYLARPVGRLAEAAKRVGTGDLDVRVPEGKGADEVAVLAQTFNDMTVQVKRQRDDLLEANAQSEAQRRLFDSVLSGVTSGVVGLNDKGKIAFLNTAAQNLLNLDKKRDLGKPMRLAVPEFAQLFVELRKGTENTIQREIHLNRPDLAEILLVHIALRKNTKGGTEGYVVAVDDVTDLVSAQRLAAWGDVARRIAHEIKNPLTPIQLSAEQMRHKFKPLVGEQGKNLDQYTDIIIRQTQDLRRIVDDFSKFARMPEPTKRQSDLVKLLRDNVALMANNSAKIPVTLQVPDTTIMASLDETMFNQAMTNLIKNALESIEIKRKSQKNKAYKPQVLIDMNETGGRVEILIKDNGIGLPKERRSRLFEPYYTSRSDGTGLGLPIVKKIIQQHDGTLELLDADCFGNTDQPGAMARITLPIQTRSA